MTRKVTRALTLLVVLALAVAACGDDGGGAPSAEDCEQVDEVRLQLQWVAQSQFAGYFAALDEGLYEARCLDVTILEGAVDIVPQQVLASGGAEFGIAWVPKALVSREAGADIVNIAQVFQRSGTLMVSWKDSGITSPEDWAGKTVGNWGFGNEYELTAAIEAFDVQDVELVAQDFTMAALLNREIDSAEAMTYNEYAQVLEAVNPDTGELYQPDDLDVINFNEVGTAMLQDSIWVNAAWIADNEDVAQRFLEATFEGWAFCRDNFDTCVEIVLDNGSTLGASHQAWQLNEINDLIWPSTAGIGVMDQALWDQTVEIATTQIPDLQGVEIGDDAFRTDLAEAAVATLEAEGIDVTGEGFEKVEVTLNEAGE